MKLLFFSSVASSSSNSSIRKTSAFSALLLLLLDTVVVVMAQQQEGNFTIEQEVSSFYNKVKTGECRKIGSMLCMLTEDQDMDLDLDDTTTAKGSLQFVPKSVLTIIEEKENGNNNSGKKVAVDIVFTSSDSASNNVKGIATTMGFDNYVCYQHICSGYASIAALTTIAQNTAIVFIKPAAKPYMDAGSVTSEGHLAQLSDFVRTNLGLYGYEVTVGILSNSFDCCSTVKNIPMYMNQCRNKNVTDDIVSLDLPPLSAINIIRDESCLLYPVDEGRAMMQIIHDVAPGARLAFASVTTAVGAAQSIRDLAARGCHIIVDDIALYDQPHFQDGIIAQAANEVAAQGVAYFSSAGNQGRNAWVDNTGFTSSMKTGPNGGTLHDFNPVAGANVDTVFNFVSPAPGTQILLLWDEPFFSPGGLGCGSDLNFYLTDKDGNPLNPLVEDTTNNKGGNALASVTTPGAGDFGLQIEYKDGPLPRYLKILFVLPPGFRFEIIQAEYSLNAPTLFGQANAANVAAVGAAYWETARRFDGNPATLEDFSSAGGTPIFFDTAGNRLPNTETRLQPRFVGPDGGANTFFGKEDAAGVYRFFGTSASAAHVAGIAALLLEKQNNQLTPAEVYKTLETTAEDMGVKGFDFDTGHGFVNAQTALDASCPSGQTLRYLAGVFWCTERCVSNFWTVFGWRDGRCPTV